MGFAVSHTAVFPNQGGAEENDNGEKFLGVEFWMDGQRVGLMGKKMPEGEYETRSVKGGIVGFEFQ